MFMLALYQTRRRLPTGYKVYYVDSTITINSSWITLMGVGATASHIVGAPGFQGTDLIYFGAGSVYTPMSPVVDGGWIRHLVLDAGASGSVQYLAHFYHAIQCGCDDVQGIPFNNGFWFDGIGAFKMHNCQTNALSGGLAKPVMITNGGSGYTPRRMWRSRSRVA